MVARAPVDVVDVDVWCSRNASWVPAFFFDFWCWYCYRSINCFRISGAYLKKVSRVLHSDNVWMGFKPVFCFTCPLPTSEGLTVSFTVKRCGVQNQLPWLYFVYDAQRDRALATQIRERKRTVQLRDSKKTVKQANQFGHDIDVNHATIVVTIRENNQPGCSKAEQSYLVFRIDFPLSNILQNIIIEQR